MPQEKEHWVTTLINSMAAKIIAFTLLGLLAIAISVGLFTNKHIKILGIEFNESDTIRTTTYSKPDTIFIKQNEYKKDTSTATIKFVAKHSPFIAKKKSSRSFSDTVTSIKQQNVNGDNNLNNGINNGNIGGHDNTIVNERHLTDVDKTNMFKLINELKKKNNSNKMCFSLLTTTNSNGGKITSEIYEALTKAGYTINGTGTVFANGILNGIDIEFNKSDSCISITVGVL